MRQIAASSGWYCGAQRFPTASIGRSITPTAKSLNSKSLPPRLSDLSSHPVMACELVTALTGDPDLDFE
jgi:hypothetical protein